MKNKHEGNFIEENIVYDETVIEYFVKYWSKYVID